VSATRWALVISRYSRGCLHGRSGRVALPRVKVVLARAARLAADGALLALRLERRAVVRSRDVDIVVNWNIQQLKS